MSPAEFQFCVSPLTSPCQSSGNPPDGQCCLLSHIRRFKTIHDQKPVCMYVCIYTGTYAHRAQYIEILSLPTKGGGALGDYASGLNGAMCS